MRLKELFEASTGKHITFCFGRMNPPTIGHEQVFKTMERVGGDFKIFVSQSQDKKENPLDYTTKTKFIKLIHPQYADNVVVDPSLNTVMKVASYLYEQGYRDATFVAGSDRLPSFQKLLTEYNGVEGKGHGFYKFDVLDFQSSGERDPDSPGVSGVSASKAREKAVAGDLAGFEEATGAGQYAKDLFNAVRKGMGVKDQSTDEGFMSFLKGEPKPKKKWNPETDSRVISNKKDNDGWIKLILDKKRRGIELTDREWHDLETWKLKQAMKNDSVEEHIVKVKGGYELKSKHGNKNLGKYPTRAGAEKRERQVQYFKHAGK